MLDFLFSETFKQDIFSSCIMRTSAYIQSLKALTHSWQIFSLLLHLESAISIDHPIIRQLIPGEKVRLDKEPPV